jgi:hypothetical protein
MSKDQLWNIYSFPFVDLNRDPFSIVFDTNQAFFLVDHNFQSIHVFVALEIISSIDHDLIEDLIECWAILDLLMDKCFFIIRKNVSCLLSHFYTSNICIWTEQNVLNLCFLLVDLFYFLRVLHVIFKFKFSN